MRSLTAMSLCLALWAGAASAEVIHREQSLYSTVLVDQRGSLLCLQFSIRRDQRNQSCIDTKKPQAMVFGYTKMMMTSLLLNPDPKRILVAGLGGGTLPMALSELYPQAEVDVVELDPAVLQVARTYFGFRPGPQVHVQVQDARVFTKRAASRDEQYDLIMLDAFNGDYIPEHLMTREYLEETRSILAADGVLVANTFAISRLYDHESVTYQAVFGTFFNLKIPESANRVIIASRRPLPDKAALQAAAATLAPKLKKFDIRIGDFLRRFNTEADWNKEARVLTDQYSPANLLRNQ